MSNVTFDPSKSGPYTFSDDNLSVKVSAGLASNFLCLTRDIINYGKYYLEFEITFNYHSRTTLKIYDAIDASAPTISFSAFASVGLYSIYVDLINKFIKVIYPNNSIEILEVPYKNISIKLYNAKNTSVSNARYEITGIFKPPYTRVVEKGYMDLNFDISYFLNSNGVKYSLIEIDESQSPIIIEDNLEDIKSKSLKDISTFVKNLNKFTGVIKDNKFKIGILISK